jgi:hypothetical protein
MEEALQQDQIIKFSNYIDQTLYLTKALEIMKETDKEIFKINASFYYQCPNCLTGYTSTLVESKFYMTHWELKQFILNKKHLTSLKCKNFNKCIGFYKGNEVITDFPRILILNCYTPTTVKCQLSFKFNEIKTKSLYSLFSCVCYKANSCKFLNFFLIGSFLFLIFEFR